MQSNISFLDGTTYKKTITRFWPLWAAYSVLWLIMLPLQGLTLLRMEISNSHAGVGMAAGYMENFADWTVPRQAEAAPYMAIMFGLLAAMAVFSHLYSARSANLYGSLPIRRETLFLSHYLAGLSFLIVPLAVTFLLTLAVEAAAGYVCMKALLFWLGVSCGECFFFYTLAVFCGMFTGHILALPAFYAIVNVFVYGVTALVHWMLERFYYGFAGFPEGVSDVVSWFTPAGRLIREVSFYWSQSAIEIGVDNSVAEVETLVLGGLDSVGIYALAAVVLAVCAFLLYRARRLESAGDVVSIQPMKPVFKYGVAVCGGMVFGTGTQWMLGGGSFSLMATILIWSVVGYFAAQMLLDKSFRVFKKWKGAVAVAGAFAALFLVVGFDLTGFVRRVPNPADVKSVFVDGLEAVRYMDTGDSVWLEVDDPEQIELLTALHQAAVDQRDEEWGPMNGCSCHVRLTYTLNNGSTMKREYNVMIYPEMVDQEGTASWVLEQLYHNTDFYWRVYELDLMEARLAEGKRLDRVEFWHYDKYNGQLTGPVAWSGAARTLLDAVEEDFKAGRIGVRSITEEGLFNHEPKDSLRFCVADSSGRKWEMQIALDERAVSTIAELKRLEPQVDLDSEFVYKEWADAFRTWVK